MSMKIIHGDQNQNLINDAKRTLKYAGVWAKYYRRELLKGQEEFTKNGKPSHECAVKLAFIGVKYVIGLLDIDIQGNRLSKANGGKYEQPEETRHNLFNAINQAFGFVGFLTLRDLVTIFPVTKTYDGEKYGCKDYFFTIDALSKMDWDKPIGRENVFNLMWDYQNEDLQRITGEYMCLISELYRTQTGIGIAEEFFNNASDDSKGDEGATKGEQTEEIVKNSEKPHMRLIK